MNLLRKLFTPKKKIKITADMIKRAIKLSRVRAFRQRLGARFAIDGTDTDRRLMRNARKRETSARKRERAASGIASAEFLATLIVIIMIGALGLIVSYGVRWEMIR